MKARRALDCLANGLQDYEIIAEWARRVVRAATMENRIGLQRALEVLERRERSCESTCKGEKSHHG